MNKKCKIYVHIYTKENLSADDLVDASRKVGVLIGDREDISHRITRCITCSDDPLEECDFFEELIVGLRVVVDGQHKTLQELKQ